MIIDLRNKKFPDEDMDKVFYPVADDEDEMMTVVDEISDEIINVMKEDTFLPVLTAVRSVAGKFEELNDGATSLIFPQTNEDIYVDMPVESFDASSQQSSVNSVVLPVLNAVRSFSCKFEELNDDATAIIFPDAEEISVEVSYVERPVKSESSRKEDYVVKPRVEPQEQRDDDAWNPMRYVNSEVLFCGGLRKCLEGVNDGVTEYVFPIDTTLDIDEESMTPEDRDIAEEAIISAAADFPKENKSIKEKDKSETKYKDKKSIKENVKREKKYKDKKSIKVRRSRSGSSMQR